MPSHANALGHPHHRHRHHRRFALTGEGYQEDVTFDMLPNDAVDELRLQDGPVGRPVQAVLALRNHSQVCGAAGWEEATGRGFAGGALPCPDVHVV